MSRFEPLNPTVMHIRYDRSPDDCLAIRVCPSDDEAHYVEILLLGYYADGHRCWLPPEVRRRSLAPCGTDEACALKPATEIAGRIARRLQTVHDPAQPTWRYAVHDMTQTGGLKRIMPIRDYATEPIAIL